MRALSDRLSGVFFLLLGLALYFWVIPAGVESVDGGNIKPDSVPNAVSLVIAGCGLLLALKPSTHEARAYRQFGIALFLLTLLTLAVYAMSLFGFIRVAPVMALAIMLTTGERRLRWLIPGVIGTPLLIWLLVSQVLDRALP